MEDREFLDLIYSQWSQTTGADDKFWMPAENDDYDSKQAYPFDLFAVDQKQGKQFLGGFKSEADADFISAIHGCLPDLVRRLHDAMDEADRLDVLRDEQEGRIFDLEVDVDAKAAEIHLCHNTISGLHSQIGSLEVWLSEANAEISKLKDRLETANANVEYWKGR